MYAIRSYYALVKDTALVYAIGIGELLLEAKDAMKRDFSIMPLSYNFV